MRRGVAVVYVLHPTPVNFIETLNVQPQNRSKHFLISISMWRCSPSWRGSFTFVVVGAPVRKTLSGQYYVIIQNEMMARVRLPDISSSSCSLTHFLILPRIIRKRCGLSVLMERHTAQESSALWDHPSAPPRSSARLLLVALLKWGIWGRVWHSDGSATNPL